MHHSYRRTLLAACAVAATFTLTGTAHAAAKASFIAVLNAGQEVPPTASNSFGNAFMTFDPATSELCYAISFSDLLTPETAAHFHGPAVPGVDGAVVADISPDGPSPLGSPKQGCVTLDADGAKALKKGLLYINIHSTDQPGGEIRGQVIPVKPKYKE